MRFFAHIVLVLRSLSQPVPVAAANAIIEAYLRILEREGNDSLVAMYAACLREGSGEESYARFLRGKHVELDCPNSSHGPKCIAHHKKRGLASREAAQLGRRYHCSRDSKADSGRALCCECPEPHNGLPQSVPSLQSSQPDVTTFSTSLNDRDVYLIRAIEWLTMVPETLPEALARSNDVARYFLGRTLHNTTD